MSTLGSKQFTESDFFFLVESFTIFFEKMLSYYDPEGGQKAKNHWVQFKKKLMDKNTTTSQIFAFCNNIKVSNASNSSDPSSQKGTGTNFSIQNMLSSKDSTQSNNNNLNMNNSANNKDLPQTKPFQISNLVSQQKRGSENLSHRGTGYLAGTSAHYQQSQQQKQQPTNITSSDKHMQSSNPNKFDSKVATKVVDLKTYSPNQQQQPNVVVQKPDQKQQLLKQQQNEQQKHYMKPLQTEPSQQQKQKQGVNQTYDQRNNNNDTTKIENQNKQDTTNNPKVIRKESRKNTRLQKQRSRTLSIDQFQAKLALIDQQADDANDENVEAQMVHLQSQQDGAGNGYKQRLEELRTKSPVISQQFTYGKQIQDKIKEDFNEDVIERIQGKDLAQIKNNQQQQQVTPQKTYNQAQQQQQQSQPQHIQAYQLNQTNSQQKQLQQQQQGQNKNNNKMQTQQISFSNLSSLKHNKPSFTSSKKDELFQKVKQGIQIIQKNTNTLDLVSDKSHEIDTTKHVHHQPKFNNQPDNSHNKYQTTQPNNYYQHHHHNTYAGTGGNTNFNNNQPHHQQQQQHQQKKSQNLKKYSVFMKQQQEQEQKQQPQQPQYYAQQQQQKPQEKVTITTTTTINKPSHNNNNSNNTSNNNGLNYNSNPVYKKLEQVYSNPSQYVKYYSNNKNNQYQGGRVIL